MIVHDFMVSRPLTRYREAAKLEVGIDSRGDSGSNPRVGEGMAALPGWLRP